MTYGESLTALSNPTRRQILELLRAGPKQVGQIAIGVPVSRSAVSQHLKILREAGLVRQLADSTRAMYEIDDAGLKTLRRWLDQFSDETPTCLDVFGQSGSSSIR